MSSIDFVQREPILENTFLSDFLLQAFLDWKLPARFQKEIKADLQTLGEMAATEMLSLAKRAEHNEPRLISYSAWGKRLDYIEMDPAWRELGKIAAQQGIVGSAYDPKYGSFGRLIQAFKLYLFHPSSAFFSCPLAMTDGAAKVLQKLGDEELKRGAFKKLISRDPNDFWTSGQWMTEKTGGSDVSETTTTAKPIADHFELHGIKWFTSSITSEMALALARIEGAPKGSKGLSLFYVETHLDNQNLNNIEILRLKNKLGTKALPTSELYLRGTRAKIVGEPGQGIKNISTMLNVTRMYNSVCALAHMNRALAWCDSFAKSRRVFGSLLAEQPLYRRVRQQLDATYLANFLMTFTLAEWVGKEEQGEADETEKAMVRFLVPVLKMFTAKHCMSVVSECLEIFGGAGYVEDTGMPTLLRDAQVFSIWEGATNVLSLDFLRVLEKEQAGEPFVFMVRKMVEGLMAKPLEPHKIRLSRELDRVESMFTEIKSKSSIEAQEVSRELSFAVAELFGGVLLANWAQVAAARPAIMESRLAAAKFWAMRPRSEVNFLT